MPSAQTPSIVNSAPREILDVRKMQRHSSARGIVKCRLSTKCLINSQESKIQTLFESIWEGHVGQSGQSLSTTIAGPTEHGSASESDSSLQPETMNSSTDFRAQREKNQAV